MNVDGAGNMNALGTVVAAGFTLADPPAPPPPVPVIGDEFQFQTVYGGPALYESLSQQSMRLGDTAYAGSWQFAGNGVAGRGAPWPGPSPVQLTFSGGATLQEPLAAAPEGASPAALAPEPVSVRFQN
jgi:hypothetical protein